MEVERLHLMCSHGEKMSMSKITETGKPARAKGVENDVSARPPNLSSASCNFDVLSPDPPKLFVLFPSPMVHLYHLASKFGAFVFKIACSQVW